MAGLIYSSHLSRQAPAPVNIDSHAMRIVLQHIDHAPPDLFEEAQQQVSNP